MWYIPSAVRNKNSGLSLWKSRENNWPKECINRLLVFNLKLRFDWRAAQCSTIELLIRPSRSSRCRRPEYIELNDIVTIGRRQGVKSGKSKSSPEAKEEGFSSRVTRKRTSDANQRRDGCRKYKNPWVPPGKGNIWPSNCLRKRNRDFDFGIFSE